MDKIDLSIVVPAYKKEKEIVSNLKSIKSVLDKLRYECEIICVVDGFLDKTFAKASAYAKTTENVVIVGYPLNSGKGHAVKYGIARSRGKIVAFIDSGADINPNGISMLLEHFEWYNADIIVGSKRHPASKVTYPWQRRVLSWGYQMLTRVLFGLKIRDTQVGLKLYRREVLGKVLPRLLVKKFAFDIEILAVANYLGYTRIFEAPIELELDFGSKSTLTNKNFWSNVFNMMWDTVAVFYRLHFRHYYSDKNSSSWVVDPDLAISEKAR